VLPKGVKQEEGEREREREREIRETGTAMTARVQTTMTSAGYDPLYLPLRLEEFPCQKCFLDSFTAGSKLFRSIWRTMAESEMEELRRKLELVTSERDAERQRADSLSNQVMALKKELVWLCSVFVSLTWNRLIMLICGKKQPF